MARQARRRSRTGIYHVTVRGIDKMDLFLDDDERQKFLSILEKCKHRGKFVLYGYCLMSNHVHLLIQEQKDSLDRIMKRVGVMYVRWFNTRYDRHGPLFEDRFASEVIEDNVYFLAALRYIHRNPVKAGMVGECEGWKWSSAREYSSDIQLLSDKEFVYGMFAKDRETAVSEYRKFMEVPDERIFLDVRNKDDEIAAAKQLWHDLQAEGYDLDECLYRFLSRVDLPSRTVASITGVGRSIIRRVVADYFG